MLLGVRFFDDRFDNEVGMRYLDIGRRTINKRSQFDRTLNVRTLKLLIVRNLVQYALDAAAECSLVGIHERHGNASLDIGGRDSLPHHTGADDSDGRNFAWRNVSLDAAGFFAPIAQEEHVEKGAIDRRAKQLWKLIRLHLTGRVEVHAGS